MLYQRKKYIQLGQLQLKGAYISSDGGASAIVLAFQSRVISTGGTFEASACVSNVIQTLLTTDIA